MNQLKWYHYNQNNSGGSFDVNDKLCGNVYVQAPTITVANALAEDMGIYFDGVATGCDCDCCGDRWYSPEELNKSDWEVKESAQNHADKYSWTKPAARMFYLNGVVEEFFLVKRRSDEVL